MNYLNLVNPSLKDIALVKVAITLWETYIRNLAKDKFFFLLVYNLRKTFRKIILDKVPQLPLPELLKEKILLFVRAIGCQILHWIEYHRHKLWFKIGVPDEFCWTPRGTIDKTKTAKMLIKDESIDVTVRYKLACSYCLEDDVGELWDKIPEDCKKDFYSEEDPTHVMQDYLVVLWTYKIKGKMAKMDSMIERKLNRRCSPYLYAFECAAEHCNRAAVEYFLQKLTSGERNESLIRAAVSVAISHQIEPFLKEEYSDILCVLLSQIDDEQQVEVFKQEPFNVLECFLDWQKQVFFIETASRMWSFLSSADYAVLLRRIIGKVGYGCKDFNYLKLLGEMWQQSLNTHKEYVYHQPITFNYLLSTLFLMRDKNTIKSIFQETTDTVKNRFIDSITGVNVCGNLINCEEWDLLKFLIQECLSSRDEVIKLKIAFTRRSHDIFSGDDFGEIIMKLDKFFLLLDDFMSEFSKRKCVEDDSSEAKRLCNNF